METPIDADAVPALKVLEETPHVLHSLLSHASADVVDWKPAPDRWSVREVLAHLVDVEGEGFTARLQAMVRDDEPEIPVYEQMAAIASGKYNSQSVTDLLKQFECKRGETLRMLLRLPVRTLDRAGRHAEIGRITVRELVNEWGFHDLGHIRQVAELVRARKHLAAAGPLGAFYNLKP
jgi:hypothetical protein